MSTNQTETGYIKFTKNGARQVMKKIKNVQANWQDLRYSFALELYEQLKDLPKSKQSSNGARELVSFQARRGWEPSRMTLRKNSPCSNRMYLTSEDLWSLSREIFRGKGGALCKPRKSAFPKPKSTDKDLSFYFYGCSLEMGEDNLLKWHVAENNHAADSACQHPVSKIIMSEYLGREYQWKRGEGGTVQTYSEDHEDGELYHFAETGFGKDAPKPRAGSNAEYGFPSWGAGYGRM
ncbi:hypothetical protein [Sulfitobacter sp. R18_1]|uniref:hypothetical protein n=1 Tax=Sulfitobacter sp. R18_1 TaxID=2821104 RepID=UPI001ADA9F03|nr:hypothetical protein [Sulfitobacter sp. R18_1]MBO9428171.1 hypothetical protein [Sulfitobacter sp. R18_1]